MLAGLTGRVATSLGWYDQLGGRLLAAAAGLVLAVLVLAVARELWPQRRLLQLIALGVAIFSPVLVRSSSMYHPETLAAALAAAGTLGTIRVARGRSGPGVATLAGVAFGLGVVTRTWALPLGIAGVCVLALAVRPRRVLALAACGIAFAVISGAWLVNQKAAHGSPLAFNRSQPDAPLLERRPASFWLGPRILESFSHPYAPHARNQLVPQVYADWWGDYALTWRPGPALLVGVPQVDVGARRERIATSLLGVVPTSLGLAGLIALAAIALRRRDPALGLVPLGAVALGVAYLLFQLRYPSPDGDTLKASYLLCGLPAFALSVGFAGDVLSGRSRTARIVLSAAGTLFVIGLIPSLLL